MSPRTDTSNTPATATAQPTPTLQTNVIHHGDNLDILRTLPDECVDLIYLDPPFNTNRTRRGTSRSSDAASASDAQRGSPTGAAITFDDRFASTAAYIDFMRPRCVEFARVLKPTGSLYHHCDYRAVHHVKVMLDGILGESSFLNEIIWVYESGGRARRHFHRKHDTLLLYAPGAVGGAYTFNGAAIAAPRNRCPACGSERTKWNNLKKHDDGTGRVYRTIRSNGKEYRYYDDEPTTPSDVWHINHLQQKDPERADYPTQKPLALLERIIKVSSNESDLILDPFAGSGTTLVAAQSLDRRWIGIDKSESACAIAAERLRQPTSPERQ